MQALLLAAVVAVASDAAAEVPIEPPPAEERSSQPAPDPTPSPTPTPDPTAEQTAAEGSGQGWVDSSHARVERGMDALVHRIDRFFGEPSYEPALPPSTRIRLRGEVRSAEEDAFNGRTSIAADLRLPTADRLLSRFSLLITGETDPEPAIETEVDRVPPRFDARVETAGGALELRYDIFRARRTLVDAGAGVRFGLPPPPFTRLRLIQGIPLVADIQAHLSQSVFWDRREGFGETTRLDAERAFGSRTLARWWAYGTVDEISRGYEWGSEAGVHRALGARTAVYVAGALAGATRSVANVDRYRVYTRVRRDIHDGWTFLEVEPEVTWPADELTGARTRSFGLILRLEVQFSSDDRRPTPLAEGGPSPTLPAPHVPGPGGA